ncbi:hypothetical protein SUGI_0766480 [Cryptomeria japonica]|uniref:zinc transporter 6, chloroplastic n=1 Tax=Cryptomeria japonica TaxID=3369 RepID=UPI002414C050|nr:zinc transporter 6, chloroplastic [Cryptomeria japonica]GLJ37725.1 hypothetical protein SUGI_0766480 [Cryptomeria japonica]
MADCSTLHTVEGACRDSKAAFWLKLLAIAVILVTGAAGVSVPVLYTRYSKALKSHGSLLSLVKCFAAGVILSTGFVHVLPEAFAALSSNCLPKRPWKDFPFAGMVAMAGALATLAVDILADRHSQTGSYIRVKSDDNQTKFKDVELAKNSVFPVSCCGAGAGNGGEINGGLALAQKVAAPPLEDSGEDLYVQQRQKLVSKVLEIGIIFHSVIIGITLGMSQNRCSIAPLVAALGFHQFFEGMGLGGCIALADFGTNVTVMMCVMFSVTTPFGIMAGMVMNFISGYDENNPKALILEGLFGSASSGILVYMALVDLIAAEFLNSKKLKSNSFLMSAAYVLLVLGAGSMSLLALWA